jgi:hypothetical protein
VQAGKASEVPDELSPAATITMAQVWECLENPEHRWFAEPGVDFDPENQETLRKKIHAAAKKHRAQAHTRTLADGRMAFWFERRR